MRVKMLSCLSALILLAGCASDLTGQLSTRSDGQGVDPETIAGDYLQGRFAASRQQYQNAAMAFDRAMDSHGHETIEENAFRYTLAAGEFRKASSYARELIDRPAAEDDEGHSLPIADFLEVDLPRLVILADYFRNENYNAVREESADQFSSSLGIAIASLLEAWGAYEADGAAAASAVLSKPRGNGFNGFTPLHLGIMFDLEGQNEAAEVAFASSLNAPGSDIAVKSYAEFVERNKPREDAVDLYAKLSEDRGYLRRIGRMGLARLGEPLSGETKEFIRVANKEDLRLVSSSREGAAIVFVNFAWAAYERAFSQLEAAAQAGFGDIPLNLEVPLALAQLAVAIDDDLDSGHYIIGAILAYYEQFEAAERAYAKVTPQSWLYNYAAIDRAEMLVALERRKDAMRLIKAYLKQDALAPDVSIELAQLLADSGETEEALEAVTVAISIADRLSSDQTRSDNLWRYYFARGAIAAEADMWTNAEADLKKALELSPDDPGLLNYLGYSYVERGENLDEAFDMIKRALDERPTSGAITDSLGWAYYQRGDYRKAVEYLEKAVELEPGDDVITDHLGDAYWQVGRKTEARFEWRRVLEIENLDPALRARVEEKLDGKPPAPGSLLAPE